VARRKDWEEFETCLKVWLYFGHYGDEATECMALVALFQASYLP
jgi:hypothetical protein